METSIIVRMFNEEKHLNRLFDGFDRQTYKDFEVIAVDSGSLDRSREIAGKRAARLVCINSHDFTYGYSLNAGIKEAQGRFIAIASAHTIPENDHWLENLIAPLREEKTAMSYGRQIGAACSKFSENEDYKRMFGDQKLFESMERLAVNNANSAIRKELWEQYPFDEKLLGLEDIDWAKHWMARGYKAAYEPAAVLKHIHEETWGQIRRRAYREAVSFRRIGIKSRASAPRELMREIFFTLSDFYNAVTVNDNPVSARLTPGQRMREIIYYRLHKNTGALKGLLESHPLETRESQEKVFFDRPTEAVVIHGPNRAAFEELKIPEIKPGDVLIRVAHVAVCATDLEIFSGALGYYKNGMAKYPIVPGHEFSGRVVAVGRNVKNLAEQTPVVVECIQSCGICGECRSGNFIGCGERAELGVLRRNGAYAGYVSAPARFVHKLPQTMDLRRAALAEPLAVVLKSLRRLTPLLGAKSGRRHCFVVGAGPLGHMFAKTLAHFGHEVTAFDRNPKRRALFDGTGIKSSDCLDDLAKFNVIIEITGDPEVLDKVLHLSPADASILLLGLPYGKKPFSFEAVTAYDKTVVGSVGSTAEDFEEAIKLLDKLDLDAYLQCPMRLDDFHAAWEKSKSGDVLKVILDVDEVTRQ
ncbi:MAG: hypothetical protein A3G18_09415 [Rhodospirillales bacterium RIFCSPLOWO2_12_FULL_58_28]|nr:MAG: hypothetical protein A3H92_02255 [Rhodospirillales bacterium RIFCSPLOWO2_02_FULL_58_16]OHC76723.1 MAG: hypothetical protein A3G18_09415 [Rhodospirillales bacterium RIFCSPLOWO2_12_FULL_58_28]